MPKSLLFLKRYLIFINIYRLAWSGTFSGPYGESPFANSSEFTNWLHSSISGNSEYDAVVFPDPLHPDTM